MEKKGDSSKPKVNGTIKLTQISQDQIKFDYDLSMNK
jgi:hypothetical protein